MASGNSPYIPTRAIFHESVSRPEIFNEHNHRLERVIGDMKEIIRDTITMKNIVMSGVQNLVETVNQNSLAVFDRINELADDIHQIRNKQAEQFEKVNGAMSNIVKTLAEITDRLTEYEVEPEFDDGLDKETIQFATRII